MNDIPFGYDQSFGPLAHSPVDGWTPFTPANIPVGGMGTMALAMAGQYLHGQTGYVPMGMGYQGNLYNNIQYQNFSRAHLEGMTKTAQDSAKLIFETQKGLWHAQGKQINAAETENLQKFSNFASQAWSLLPEQLRDTLAGGRDPVSLFHHIHLGGQTRQDPVTGWMGMSAASSLQAQQGVWDHYFKDDQWGRRTAGLTSSQMAGMFDDLQRRGMMVSSGTDRERVVSGLLRANQLGSKTGDILSGVGADANTPMTTEGLMSSLTDKQVSALRGNADVQHGMRSGDTGRVIQTLDKYKGALAAVQEIFGDAGHPNAPMQQLMHALDTLAQGGLQQIDPGRTEMVVRNLYNAAKTANIDMHTAGNMFNAANEQLGRQGNNPLFAGQMVTSGLLFNSGFQMSGVNNTPTWGAFNSSQATAAHMVAYGNAVNSDAANRLGAAMRLSERVGGLRGDAAALVAEVKEGRVPSGFAEMGHGEFIDMLARGSRLSPGEVSKYLHATAANEEFVYKNNLGGLVTGEIQKSDFLGKIIKPAFTQEALAFARQHGGGMNARSRGAVANTLADVASATIARMKTAERHDPLERNKRVVATIEARLSRAAGNSDEGRLWQRLQGMGNDERNRHLTSLAETMYTGAEERLRSMPGMQGAYLGNEYDAHSAEVTAAKAQAKAGVELKSVLQSSAAGTLDTSGSPLFRLMKSIQEGGRKADKATITSMISTALGGVASKDVAEKLGGDLYALGEAEAKVEELRNKRSNTNDSGKKRQIDAQIAALAPGLEQQRSAIKQFMHDNNLDSYLETQKKQEEAAKQAQEASKNGSFTMTNATINITSPNAEIVLKNAQTSGAKDENRGGSPVTA